MLQHTTAGGGLHVGKQSTRHPRDIIVEIIEHADDPRDREKLFSLFREQIDGDDELQRAVDWYFFVNMHSYITMQRHPRRSSDELGATLKQQRETTEATAKVIAKKIVLLNQEMPNGKILRHCTMDYLYRLGGVYKMAGMRGNQTAVGEVYSEKQLRAKLKDLA